MSPLTRHRWELSAPCYTPTPVLASCPSDMLPPIVEEEPHPPRPRPRVLLSAEQSHSDSVERRGVIATKSFLGSSFWTLTLPGGVPPSSRKMGGVTLPPPTEPDCFRPPRSLA